MKESHFGIFIIVAILVATVALIVLMAATGDIDPAIFNDFGRPIL